MITFLDCSTNNAIITFLMLTFLERSTNNAIIMFFIVKVFNDTVFNCNVFRTFH